MYHNFDGELLATELDRRKAERDNDFLPNSRATSKDEQEEFVRIMKLLDPSYEMRHGWGTVTIVDNLLTPCDSRRFHDTKLFLQGLYHKDHYPNIEIKMYDCTNGQLFPEHDTHPTITVKPIDLSFGTPYTKPGKTYNAYYNSSEQRWTYSDKPLDPDLWENKYSFVI